MTLSEPVWVNTLLRAVTDQGFVRAGIVDIDLAETAMKPHHGIYNDWIREGRHGDMAYLERGRSRRLNVREVYPEAQSLLIALLPYSPVVERDPGQLQFAAYLESKEDYHSAMKTKLEAALRQAQEMQPHLQGKVCVDTSAVLERSWAVMAGLGWIGKNTLLLTKEFGSFTFIGSILLNSASGRAPVVHPDLCGQCRACLDACPTKAFVSERVLDSRTCLSYLTLEKRGPLSGDESQLLNAGGQWVAGCDVCQDVCPFNRKTQRHEGVPASQSRWDSQAKEWRKLGEAEYRQKVKGTALSRIQYENFMRNLDALSHFDKPDSK